MSISNVEKVKYIKNHFHQYFDLTFNEIATTNPVNIVLPFSQLYGTKSAYSILLKYPDTTVPKETYVYCTKVVDGDTIWVKNATVNEDKSVELGDPYKVRFSGVDTPEVGTAGADKATEFVKQLCLYKFFYIKIDSKRKYDSTEEKRIRAVIIVHNKNLNEVLIREKLADVMYIPPSDYNSKDWNHDLTNSIFTTNQNDLGMLSPFLNSNLTNVIFTPKNNYDTIYRYEVYKDVFYIRADPFSKNIRMHLFPKNYDCSDRLLFLKDDMVEKRTITKSNNYKVYENKNNINCYYQENGRDRNRNNITNRDYSMSTWGNEKTTNTFAEFSYDVSNDTKGYDNIEICVGYKYNQTTPFYAIHYTGVKDKTNLYLKDRTPYVDVNIDGIKSNPNGISKFFFDSKNTPSETDDEVYLKHDIANNLKKQFKCIDHLTNINQIYHKKIKYINDCIYVEENSKSFYKDWPTLKTVISAKQSEKIQSGQGAGNYYLDISVKDGEGNGYPNTLVMVDKLSYYTPADGGSIRVIVPKGKHVIIANDVTLEFIVE